MVAKDQLGLRISPAVLDFFAGLDGTRSSTAQYALESWAALYRGAAARIARELSDEQQMCIRDALSSTSLSAGMAGHHILADLADGDALLGLGERHHVDVSELSSTLESWGTSQLAMVEVWAKQPRVRGRS